MKNKRLIDQILIKIYNTPPFLYKILYRRAIGPAALIRPSARAREGILHTKAIYLIGLLRLPRAHNNGKHRRSTYLLNNPKGSFTYYVLIILEFFPSLSSLRNHP